MVDQVRVAVSTASSGSYTLTGGNPNTPVGAIFYVTSAVSNDVIASHSILGWGAADNSGGQSCLSIKNEDGQFTTDTDRRANFSSAIGLHDIGASWSFLSTLNSFVAGGVILDIDIQSDANYLLTAVFFYADDVDEFDVFSVGLGGTTSPVDYTDLGYELDAMFTGHIYTSSQANNVHSPLGLGIIYNDNATSPSQKSVAICGDDGAGSGDQNTYISNDHGLCATLLGGLRWRTTFSDITGDGFTHTNSSSTSTAMICVAMKLASGVQFDLFDLTIPTSGDLTVSGLSFEPGFGSIHAIVGPTAYNSFSATSANMSLGVSTFDSTTIFTNNITDQDTEDPTVCKSLSSDQFRVLGNDGATDAVVASSYTLESDGLDFTLSTNPATAILGFGWAISGAAAGGITVPVPTAVETDEALTVAIAKRVDVDLAVETDEALDTTVAKRTAIDLANETDEALAVAIAKQAGIDIATETDTALAVAVAKRGLIDTANETDTALTITVAKRAEVGTAVEADEALSVAIAKRADVDAANETDTALAIIPATAGAITVPVPLAIESDAGFPVTPLKQVNLDLATELDVALTITPSFAGVITVAVDTAIESDVALVVTPASVVGLDTAVEIDTALVVTPGKRVGVDTAVEADVANTITPSVAGAVTVVIDPAIEVNVAFDLSILKRGVIDTATETDEALNITAVIGGIVFVNRFMGIKLTPVSPEFEFVRDESGVIVLTRVVSEVDNGC